jgi:hypothetical protein
MSGRSDRWKLCCTKAPKDEIVYCCQLVIAYIVIIVSLLNITFTENNTCLWSTLISGTLGYLLPNPHLQKNEPLLPHTTEQQLDDVTSEQHRGEIYNEIA